MKTFEEKFRNGKVTFVPYKEPSNFYPFYRPTAQIQIYNNDSEDEEYIDLYKEDVEKMIVCLQKLIKSFPSKNKE